MRGLRGRRAGLRGDARDRALARSIATVALRRLGTIRKALARRMEKGMPKRGGALEWTLIVAAAQILFLDIPDHAAVDLAVKATRAEPASAPFAGLANAAGETGQAAHMVRDHAGELKHQADALRIQVDQFLTRVRAA